MLTQANAELDAQILKVIVDSGGTAWFIAGTLGKPRTLVSARLASMKRRNLVGCRGSYWSRLKSPFSIRIAPNSDSYPIQGASRASGVDYGLALAWADAPDQDAAQDAAAAIWCRHGISAWVEFHRLVTAAFEKGVVRLRWARRP